MARDNNEDTKVVTGPVRLSYAHLFEPYTNDEDKPPRYSVTILVPKETREGKATIRAIEKAIEAAKENGRNSVFGGKVPSGLKITFRDGDDDDSIDLERQPEYEGMMFMAISSKTKPGIVDRRGREILDADEVYSGCWARVSMRAFPYKNSGNKGISFGLNNVMKWEDGDYLGGKSRAEDDFADFLSQDDEDDDLI